MEDTGFLRYLVTAQVLPTGSPVHRLDPRVRLLGFVGLLAVFIAARHVGPALLALGATLGLVLLARVPLRYAARGLRLLLPWIILIVLVHLFFGLGSGSLGRAGAVDGRELLAWGPVRVTDSSLWYALVSLVRFVGLLLSISLLTWTLSVPEMARGIEALAYPFDRLGLPAHALAMVGVIAIRFVPTMALEAERLIKAQMARGADLAPAGMTVVKRVRRILPMVVPLFVLALRRAERLAEAMEARAYGGGRRRGFYARLQLRLVDWLALGLLVGFVAGALVWDR